MQVTWSRTFTFWDFLVLVTNVEVAKNDISVWLVRFDTLVSKMRFLVIIVTGDLT